MRFYFNLPLKPNAPVFKKAGVEMSPAEIGFAFFSVIQRLQDFNGGTYTKTGQSPRLLFVDWEYSFGCEYTQ